MSKGAGGGGASGGGAGARTINESAGSNRSVPFENMMSAHSISAGGTLRTTSGRESRVISNNLRTYTVSTTPPGSKTIIVDLNKMDILDAIVAGKLKYTK